MTDDDAILFERLIAPLEERMLATIWRILRDMDDADDAHQETLIRLWRVREKIMRHPNPQALILRICAQVALDLLRRRRRGGRHEDFADHEHHLLDPSASAPRRIESEERKREILDAIATLPRKQALAILMRCVQGQTYAQVAAALGCGEVTVRCHVARGRATLAKILGLSFEQTREGA